MKFVFITLFSIFSLLLKSLPVKVFNFKDSRHLDNTRISTVSISNPPSQELPDQFVICSSHFQRTYDTPDTYNVYIIFEDEQFKNPWFSFAFWNKRELFVNIRNEHFYYLGTVPGYVFLHWIHMCIEVDVTEGLITSYIGGKILKQHKNAKHLKPIPKLNLRLGIVHEALTNFQHQFDGKITNINVLKTKNESLIREISANPCQLKVSKEIVFQSWTNMEWKIIEAKDEENYNFTEICSNSDTLTLRHPSLWIKEKAMDMCIKLDHGKLYDFPKSKAFSGLDTTNSDECKYFWTPFTDEQKEGVFINENNGEEVTR